MTAVEQHHRVVGLNVVGQRNAVPANHVQLQLGELFPGAQLVAHLQVSESVRTWISARLRNGSFRIIARLRPTSTAVNGLKFFGRVCALNVSNIQVKTRASAASSSRDCADPGTLIR
jgi:hypothetical protein